MTEPALPRPAGVAAVRSDFSRGDRAPRQPLPARISDWASVASEYEFFTPALLHLYGKFPEAALVDLVQQHPGLVFYFRKFDLPLFDGLTSPATGSADWNFAIFAVARPFWEHVLRFLANCVVRDQDTGDIYQYFPQELRILDPFALDRERLVTLRVPIIDVVGFGVAAPRWRIGYVNGSDPRANRPAAYRLRADPQTLQYAQRFSAGENPLQRSVKELWRSALRRMRGRLLPGQSVEHAPDW